MRIHDCWWRKFEFRKGYGLFVELRLFCPGCDEGQNITQTTGFEIGKDRTIEAAAQEIGREIGSSEYRCMNCGVSSTIAPIRQRDYELEHLMDELNDDFFSSLPVSPSPAKIQGICMN